MTRARVLAYVAMLGSIGCGSAYSSTTPNVPAVDAAAPTMFTVTLTLDGEPTPCAMGMTGAGGSATVAISADGSQVEVTDLTFSGLSGPAVAAHIHFGSATMDGPPVLVFGNNPTSPIDKTFTAADYQAGAGAPATFAEFVTMARAGDAAYINVHTSKCPAGEIRGELQ